MQCRANCCKHGIAAFQALNPRPHLAGGSPLVKYLPTHPNLALHTGQLSISLEKVLKTEGTTESTTESKIDASHRLEKAGLWKQASLYRDEQRQRLRDEGKTRKDAAAP